MCGICGFVNHTDKEMLHAMADSIIHRGPDEEGFYEEGGKVSLGVRRLKVIDLETGSQPIFNEDKSIVIVFNGEIYNYKELRDVLEAKGHKFSTNTDTEVIVHLYEEFGADTPKHLRGMFAFAIWDKKRERLLLARDHLGIKPLFCALIGNELYFASELKPLLINPKISKEIDYEALNFYFTLLYIPAPLTVYKHIKKVMPGQLMVFEHNYLHVDSYWNLPEYSTSSSISSERYYTEELENLFRDSLKEQLASDVPLGVFLSGGIDSSAIVAFASEITGTNLKTFNVSYSKENSSYNEISKARQVADMFKCNHYEMIAWPDVTDILHKIAPIFGEPFADSSCIANYVVSREAGKKVTVALSGIGGDELFCGYPRFKGAVISEYYAKLPSNLRKFLADASYALPESRKARNIPGWIKRFTYGGNLPFVDRYASWVSYLKDADKQTLYSANFSSLLNNLLPLDQDIASFPNDVNSISNFEIRKYLAGDLLCTADRMSMANSLELRVPFLDIRIVEFAQSISVSDKIKGLRLKHLLRKMLEKRLPGNILNQRKMGFQVPIAGWLTQELKPLITDTLSKDRITSSGLFDYDTFQKMLSAHSGGRSNYSDQIFSVLMFELWNDFNKNISAKIKKPVEITTAKKLKLLLLNLGGIGDIVMMTPILRALLSKKDTYEISLLTIGRSAAISKMLDGIDKIYSIDMASLFLNMPKLAALVRTFIGLRREKFDVLINLRMVFTKISGLKMMAAIKLINPKFSIGRNIDGNGTFYDYPFKEQRNELKNEISLTAGLLRPLGLYDINTKTAFPVSQKDRNFIKELFKKHSIGSDFLIGMIPGAFRPSRRWPVNHWKNLINMINEKYKPYKIFIAGSAEELDFVSKLQVNPSVIVTNGNLDFGQLAALLERMHIVVANDTGLMHLAAAVGSKVVGIFGPGDVHRHAPVMELTSLKIVRNHSIKCRRPCYKFSCKDPKCLTEITPFKVFDALGSLIT